MSGLLFEHQIAVGKELMLKNLLSLFSGKKPAKRNIDYSLGHPELGSLREAVITRDWQGFERRFNSLRADERNVLLSALAFSDVSFDGWRRATGTSIAYLFEGTREFHLAAQARGAGRASTVTEEGARKFFEHLDLAIGALTRANELDADDPEPLCRLIPAFMGSGQDPEESRALFQRCMALCPEHLGAALAMLDVLTPKWQGSKEEMFAFARGQADAQPLHLCVIAHAHAESWLYSRMQGDDSAPREYFRSHDVRRELVECWEGEKLPNGPWKYWELTALNLYAFCFSVMEEKTLARPALESIGERCTNKPWLYVTGDCFEALNLAREDAGLQDV